MATFVAMVANGGERVTPHLVREFVGPDGHRERADLAPVRSIVPDLSPHLRTVRGMMRRVVAGERGTGRRAAADGLAVAGKTGTSQNPHGDDHAVFVSYAPYEDPHLALVVFLEDCGHGGEVAAPVAGEFWAAYAEWRRQRAEGPIG
jgi:penicillin-binding protein 2